MGWYDYICLVPLGFFQDSLSGFPPEQPTYGPVVQWQISAYLSTYTPAEIRKHYHVTFPDVLYQECINLLNGFGYLKLEFAIQG